MSLELKLIVLDWAGTAIDFGCLAPVDGFVRVFAARGVRVSPAEARGPMGTHKRDHIRELLKVPAIADRWHAAHARAWAEADVEEMYREAAPMLLAAVPKHAAPVPHLLATVAEVRRRGLKIAGTTGYFRQAAELCYTVAREHGYAPDFTICADEVPAGRPAPWMLFRAMEATGVFPPAAVLKVGDTVSDIGDGRNAGAWSVGVIDTGSEMGLSAAEFAGLSADEREKRRAAVRATFRVAGAHAAIQDLSELPALVDAINRRLAAGERP